MKAKEEFCSAAKNLVVSAECTVMQGIMKNGVMVSKNNQIPPSELSPTLKDNALLMHASSSEKKFQLIDTKKVKQELETKLKLIHNDINQLSVKEQQLLQENNKKEYSWLTEQDRLKWKEDMRKKEEEAAAFAKKMEELRKIRKKKYEEQQKEMLEKLQKENEDRKRIEEEAAKLLEQQKKEKQAKKLEEMNKKREERQNLLNLAKVAPEKKKPLYEKMQEKFLAEVEMPELEKRKKDIAEKRNIYKPVKKEDLDSHKRMFEEALKKREEEKKKELEKLKIDAQEYMEKANNELKSKFTEEVIKKEQEEKEKFKAAALQPKEAYNKKMTYAKIVKESCAPTVSEQKALELQRNIERLKHPVRKPKEIQPGLIKTNKTSHNLSSAAIKECEHTDKGNKSDSEEKVKKIAKTKRKSSKNTAPGSPKNENNEQPKKKAVDYLTEMRKNREVVGASNNSKAYEALLKNDDIKITDKYDLVKAQADILEENARRKEQLLTIKGEGKNDQAGQEVSDMYINAIKAKLSLLDL